MLVTSWTEIMTSYPPFQNILILRRPRVASFADIIKIITIFFKTVFKDSKKVKRIWNYVPKSSLYLYFLIYQNLLISSEVIYNCTKFHHCRICMTVFRQRGGGVPFCPTILGQSRKGPSWIGLGEVTKLELRPPVSVVKFLPIFLSILSRPVALVLHM